MRKLLAPDVKRIESVCFVGAMLIALESRLSVCINLEVTNFRSINYRFYELMD